MMRVKKFAAALLALAVAAGMAMPASAAGRVTSFENGFADGWGKENPESVIEADAEEKAIRIDGKTGAQLLFEPETPMDIGMKKNQYMKVRIKGDPSIYRFVAYYIVEADTPDAVFGPTLRLKKDLTVKADEYTDIIMDMYYQGEGYGAQWDGQLRKFRLDIHNEAGTTAEGEIFIQYIGFFDTEAEAKAYPDETTEPPPPTEPEESSEPTAPESSAANTTPPTSKPTTKPTAGAGTSNTASAPVSDANGDSEGMNPLPIVLIVVGVVILAGGITAFILLKKRGGPKDDGPEPQDSADGGQEPPEDASV